MNQKKGSGCSVHCRAGNRFQRGELLGLEGSAAGVGAVLGYYFHQEPSFAVWRC